MNTVTVKSDLHKIIDNLQDENLLHALRDFLKIRENAIGGQLWKNLTQEQKETILLAFEESKNEENLVKRDQVFKQQ